MASDLVLRAFEIAEGKTELDFQALAVEAIEAKYGERSNDPDFLKFLLAEQAMGEIKREFKKSALDPDKNDDVDALTLFPMPHYVMDTTDNGEDVVVPGKVATVAQVDRHYTKVARTLKAKVRKVEEFRTKVVALRAVTRESGDDPTNVYYADAVEKYGRNAIEAVGGD